MNNTESNLPHWNIYSDNIIKKNPHHITFVNLADYNTIFSHTQKKTIFSSWHEFTILQ